MGGNMTIQLSVAAIVYAASCITIVAGAIKILWEVKKKLQQPLDDLAAKIEDHDKFLKNDKQHLERVDYALEDLTVSLNMLVRSNRVILDHLQEGNHTGEIKAELKAIDNWLLESREYKGVGNNYGH